MDNQIYGLTKGQLSPTSPVGRRTASSPFGALEAPVNPLLYVLAYGAGFVAQGTPADMAGLAAVIEAGIRYPGFAFVNVQSPCVTFGDPEWQLKQHKATLETLESRGHDSSDRLKAMALAQEYGTRLYTGVFYRDPDPPPASLPGMAERTVVVDSASKTYAMPGWRIGYAVNRRLAPLLARWVTNTDSCAPHMGQWAVARALNGSQQAALAMRESFRQRRDFVVKALDAVPGVRCLRPGGAFYAWPNVTDLCAAAGLPDSEALRRVLLDEAGLALLSDVHFGSRIPGEGEHLRLSFAASMADLEEGVRRLDAFARSRTAQPVGCGPARRAEWRTR
jgi:hypothetical protein